MKKILALPVALGFVLLLGACSMDRDTYIMDKKIRLVQGEENRTIPTAALDGDIMREIGDHYSRYGDGPVDVTVTFDPKSKRNTAMRATNEAARIAQGLGMNGVGNVVTTIMPVGGSQSSTLVTYRTVTAQAPDCQTMGGLDGKQTGADQDYEIGCTIKTQMAREIVRPKDLAGRDGFVNPANGRRYGNIVEGYQTGQPNSAIQGESTQ